MSTAETDQSVPGSSTSCSAKALAEVQRRKEERVRERAEETRRLTEIQRTLNILHPQPGAVIEIRVLEISGHGRPYQSSGYFDDFAAAAKAVLQYEEKRPLGIYVVLNCINPALLARSANKMTDHPKYTTSDKEIERRQWLLLDLDPVRPSGICANDIEHAAASRLAADIEEMLQAKGWPSPLIGRTGSGFALLYRLDLPNDDETTQLIKQVLHGIQCRTDLTPNPNDGNATARVDCSTFNLARIGRLFGTWNRKGDNTLDRPHRCSELFDPPDEIGVVTREQLTAVAAWAPVQAEVRPFNSSPAAGPRQSHSTGDRSFSRLDVSRWLGDRGISYRCKQSSDGLDLYLITCPFDSNHGAKGETCITQARNGRTGASCKHDSCSGRRWREFANAFGPPEPHHYDPPLRTRSSQYSPSSGPQQATANDKKQANQSNSDRKILSVISSADFAAANYEQRFLVKGILVADQPAICGGRSKSLKTTTLLDLAISLGTGSRFLNRFDASNVNVAVLSGESGHFTIQETARRIAAAKQVNLADASIFWGFDLPQLARPDDLSALGEVILANNVDVAIVDPAYLCLLGGDTQGRQASNIFDMGPLLLGLTEVGQKTGATIILCHHCRKNLTEPWQPPELEDLSMAGFGEWARQWMLLGRREQYQQGSGLHRLWINVGGSAGHSGCWAVDIDEGVLGDDFTGRHWHVDVKGSADAVADNERRKEQKKAEKAEQTEFRHKQKLKEALTQCPNGETAKRLGELAGLSPKNFGPAITALLKEGRAENCQVVKGKVTYDGYKPTGL